MLPEMRFEKLFENPLQYIDVALILDFLDEESYIAASEIDSPNSPDFDRVRSKIHLNYVNRFYRSLASEILRLDPIVAEFGPHVRISAVYKVELHADDEWKVDITDDVLNTCVKHAQALRRQILEGELKGVLDGKGARAK